MLLVLRAFASGATAMTGIEVISNAVPVFRPPQAEHARQTLSVMMALLISMFIGVCSSLTSTAPPRRQPDVLSQIAHRSVGGGVALRLRAGGDHARAAGRRQLGLQRLSAAALLHGPRQLRAAAVPAHGRSPRIHNGILVLAVPAAVIYAAFGGQTAPLIPLFAIGVFLAFTLAQSGMVAHWWRHRERGWRSRARHQPPRRRRSRRWSC